MKLKCNKDGSRDYVFSRTEFDRYYLIGCVISRNNKRVVVRAWGPVKDLKQVVMRYEQKTVNSIRREDT